MDESSIKRAISRISHEIIEKNKGAEDIILVGIVTRGKNIADRIAEKIYEIEEEKLSVYPMNIKNYRDDISKLDIIQDKAINEDINNKKIILVDDVISTGRSVRAGIDGILAHGRPKSIQLVALIDRGHRELPISPDYVGKNVPTSKSEIVSVKLFEVDNIDQVMIKK